MLTKLKRNFYTSVRQFNYVIILIIFHCVFASCSIHLPSELNVSSELSQEQIHPQFECYDGKIKKKPDGHHCDSGLLLFTFTIISQNITLTIPLKRQSNWSAEEQDFNSSCRYIVSPLPSYPTHSLNGSINWCNKDSPLEGIVQNDSLTISFEYENGKNVVKLNNRSQVSTKLITTYERLSRQMQNSNPNVRGYAVLPGIGPFHLKIVFIWPESINSDQRKVHLKKLQQIVPETNSLFASLRVIVTLMDIVYLNHEGQIPKNSTIDEVMYILQQIRINQFLPKYENFTTIFVTLHPYSDYLGLSSRGSCCTRESNLSFIDFKWISYYPKQAALFLAQLIGDNLGFVYEGVGQSSTCQDDRCSNRGCIMTTNFHPSLLPYKWSRCSKARFADLIKSGYGKCLFDPPVDYFKFPNCGNGIVEDGEECDCSRSGCKCCDGRTCLLADHACCGSGSCCNMKTCLPYDLSDRFICRNATSDCDLAEYCDGTSEFCPEDTYVHDGTNCDDYDYGYCYEGQCSNLKAACSRLWGETTSPGDSSCFQNNSLGQLGNDCGYKEESRQFIPCAPDDILCGRLQCSPDKGTDTYSIASRKTEFYHSENCTSLLSPFTTIDPAMVPDGTICGQDKVCFNTHCISRNDWPAAKYNPCPDPFCSDHGKCNNQGKCQCDIGYKGPTCTMDKQYFSRANVSLDSRNTFQLDNLSERKVSVAVQGCRNAIGIYGKVSTKISGQQSSSIILLSLLLIYISTIFIVWIGYRRIVKLLPISSKQSNTMNNRNLIKTSKSILRPSSTN